MQTHHLNPSIEVLCLSTENFKVFTTFFKILSSSSEPSTGESGEENKSHSTSTRGDEDFNLKSKYDFKVCVRSLLNKKYVHMKK